MQILQPARQRNVADPTGSCRAPIRGGSLARGGRQVHLETPF